MSYTKKNVFMRKALLCSGLSTMLLGFASAASSQTVVPQTAGPDRMQVATTGPTSGASAPATASPPVSLDKLTLHFENGSTTVRSQDRALLDQAARLFRDAHPVVMIVAGGTDAVGSPAANLGLSEARARNVVQDLVARGIPIEHFQLLAKGITDPAIANAGDAAEPGNRVVEIRWR